MRLLALPNRTFDLITKYLRIALAAVTFASPSLANAEDTDNWSGTYLGLGASMLDLNTDQFSLPQGEAPYYLKGSYGGGHRYGVIQGEVRRQSGTLVWGVRLRHQETGSEPDAFLKKDEIVSANLTSLTSLSGTLGYAVKPKMLVYASAGIAHGRFDYGSVDDAWSQVDYAKGSTEGVTLGLGAEYQLTDRISIFSEYTHTKFSTSTVTFLYPPPSETTEWSYDYEHDFGEISLGMNFRF